MLPIPARRSIAPLWEVEGRGKAFVDLQNDVTADDIRLAHRKATATSSMPSATPHTAWRRTRARPAGSSASRCWRRRAAKRSREVGVPTFRPYVTPVTWGALAGREVGQHFQPIRRTALHDWHERHGAVFLETGLWLRPLYYTSERRDRLGADPARSTRRAHSRRSLRCLHAGQDRYSRAATPASSSTGSTPTRSRPWPWAARATA